MIKIIVKKSVKPIRHTPHLAFDRGKKMSAGLVRQGFVAKKYYLERSGGLEIFLSKPEGHGLACRRGLTLPQEKAKMKS